MNGTEMNSSCMSELTVHSGAFRKNYTHPTWLGGWGQVVEVRC